MRIVHVLSSDRSAINMERMDFSRIFVLCLDICARYGDKLTVLSTKWGHKVWITKRGALRCTLSGKVSQLDQNVY